MEEAVSTKYSSRPRSSPRGSRSQFPGTPGRLFSQDILIDVLPQMCSLSQSLFKFMGNISICLNIDINLAELQLQVSDFCFYHDIKRGRRGEGQDQELAPASNACASCWEARWQQPGPHVWFIPSRDTENGALFTASGLFFGVEAGMPCMPQQRIASHLATPGCTESSQL